MRTLTLTLFATLTACPHRLRTVRAAAPVPVAPATRAAVAPWEPGSSRSVPSPILDVAALSCAEAVFAHRDGIYRWDGVRPATLVCRTTSPPQDLHARGDLVLALTGLEDAPVVWRSERRGDGCEPIALPSLSVQGHRMFPLRTTLEDDVAFVWSASGRIARSDDRGAHWRILPRIDNTQRVAVGPRGSTLAAVLATQGSLQHLPRAALYQLDADRDGWRLVPDAGARRLPISTWRWPDGSVTVVDPTGAVTLSPDGAIAARHDYAEPWSNRSPTAIIVPITDGRFFAAGASSLTALDPQHAHALAWPEGLRAVRAIDAAPDGTLWLTDGVGVWRSTENTALQELSERPLDGTPTRMAARGDTLALTSGTGQLARSLDRGAHWRRFDPPTQLGAPIAVTIDARGAVLVLFSGTLMVCEGDRVSVVETPQRNSRTTPHPVLASFGDRWLYIDGEVFTTDDQGAHWTARFGPGAPSGAGLVAAATTDPRDRVLLLDQAHSLWVSTDAATSFTRWSDDPFQEASAATDAHGNRIVAPSGAAVALAWDGADEAFLLSPTRIAHTRNGGASFAVDNASLAPADMALGPDGHLFVVAESAIGSIALCPFSHDATLLWVSRGDGFVPVTQACEHRASAWAFDGDHILLTDPSGTITRGSLVGLAEPNDP